MLRHGGSFKWRLFAIAVCGLAHHLLTKLTGGWRPGQASQCCTLVSRSLPSGRAERGPGGSRAHARSRAHHNSFDASRAPSASAASFIHTILESTCSRPAKVPKPQSTPAMTFSRPTTRAYCTKRSATSSEIGRAAGREETKELGDQ